MKTHLRELLADLQAAARIGRDATLQAALEGVRALPDDSLPPAALLPLGQSLTPLPASQLSALLGDEDAAVRGLAAVALGVKYLRGEGVRRAHLYLAAGDPNPEVRRALVRSLLETHRQHPASDRLRLLVETWLPQRYLPEKQKGAAARRLQTALGLLPASGLPPQSLTSRLRPLDQSTSHELRLALLDCLNALAEGAHTSSVLELLREWVQRSPPNVWLITHALSASWARRHSAEALAILDALAARVGPNRAVSRAQARHQLRT